MGRHAQGPPHQPEHFLYQGGLLRINRPYLDAGTAASARFTWADNGSYTVYARVFDKDGGDARGAP
jgi:hypothetical protein